MGQLNRLAQCHFEARGEANALAATPDSVVFASGGDDCTVRIWDGGSFRQKAMCSVSSKVRALAFQTDGSQLAVGCYEGRVKVFSTNLQDQIADVAISSAWIQAMRYSPDGQTLAVGSHDCRVYLLNAVAYCIRHVCIGHHSFITALDFSADSNKLQSASGDYELLFWSSADGKQIKRMAEVCDVKWATWTSSIGWPVQGIFPPDTDGTDVNSVSASPDGRLLVTGDDFRRVKLFRYPVPIQGAKFKEYKGHSEHVTNVVFLGDSGVVSIGGLDKSILQFEIKKK
jgi:microtubule-associated protein-like 6